MSDTLQKMRDAYWEGTPDIDDGPMNATERASWEAAARVLLEDLYQWHPWIASDYAISLGIDLSEQPADSKPEQDAPAAGAEQPVPEGHG